jgi:transcription-repair coupling factor (superfamily II helicase)
MAGLTTEEEVDRIHRELEDRFGTVPEEAENLIYLLRLKVLATAAGVEIVTTEGNQPAIGLGTVAEVKRRRAEGRLPKGVKVVDDRLLLPTSMQDKGWQRGLEDTLRDMAA